MENIPPVDRKLVQSCLLLELHITRKSYWIDLQELQSGGKPATIRSWKSFYSVLCGQLLSFLRLVDEISSLIKFNLKPNYFRDQEDFFEAKAASSPIMIYQVSLSKHDYTAWSLVVFGYNCNFSFSPGKRWDRQQLYEEELCVPSARSGLQRVPF